jgi:hypothetical protein
VWFVFLIGSGSGAGCGLARVKLWVLIPATLLLTIIAVSMGWTAGSSWSAIALTAIVGSTSLQWSYLIGTALSDASKRRASRVPVRQADLLHAIQSAIGRELKRRYEVSQELPWQIGMRVAQLEVR